MTLDVTILDSITNVKRKVWDGLFDDALGSYDWLLSFEKSRPIQILPRHFIVSDKNQTVAVVPCFLQFDEVYSTIEDRIFGRIQPWSQRLGFKLLPALIAYLPLMYKSLLGIDKHADRKEILYRVLQTMDEVARREKAIIYGFGYLSQTHSTLTSLLREHSFSNSIVVPDTYIDITWDDFEGYLTYLRGRYRRMGRKVRREIKKNKKAGIQIVKSTDFRHLKQLFAAQCENTYFRHTMKNSPFTEDFFHNLSIHAKGTAKAYCAFKGSILRGFSIVLEGKDRWHVILCGQDYEVGEDDFTYFNVVFYEPIKEAIAKNARRIYFGAANYEAKLRRGCLIEPLYMYLKSPNMAINRFLSYWLKITEIWYKRKHRNLFKE